MDKWTREASYASKMSLYQWCQEGEWKITYIKIYKSTDLDVVLDDIDGVVCARREAIDEPL